MRKGFTLIEILIVMAIVAILATILTTTLNPIEMMNRARDTQRKKDLNRIKIAFEEYQNDKGSYPGRDMVALLTSKSNCNKKINGLSIPSWPCDPNGNPYYLMVEAYGDGTFMDKPQWYKVLTNLENKKDKDIPDGWYEPGMVYHVGLYTNSDVNYGVSSGNVSWHDKILPPTCSYNEFDHNDDICFTKQGPDCKAANNNACSGSNCYAINNCRDICKVDCCGTDCY